MDSIVKLLLALIIGYCFVKLFCGCSVEGISEKQILSKIEEEGEEIEEEIRENYNPTPVSTPTSNNAPLGSIFGGCDAGEEMGSWDSCHKCPIRKYNHEDGYDKKCKYCPAGSYPVDKNNNYTDSGAVACQFCGYYNEDEPWIDPDFATPYELPAEDWNVNVDWFKGIGRYLDGTTCKTCPEHSTLKPGVKDLPVDYSWWKEGIGWTKATLLGGRNVNDCICSRGYIKVKNDGGGGWRCQKCDTDNKMYPNKPPEQNPDKCVKLGGDECPYIKFSQGACNDPNVCDDGYEAIILPGGGNQVGCVKKGG